MQDQEMLNLPEEWVYAVSQDNQSEAHIDDKEEDKVEEEANCHTRFYKENLMHLICAPRSNQTHMIDNRV
jgi:hypothetical protein